ncbi:TldD/PmbA family protein [Vibrio vulnificus]|uniref:TldD/PmbA family protein n=1 Tax=Vibrio vulnificus TaxID=672 RepID=UPI00102349C6|nr:TldD/PmbA family protein [Vibrio vulnificus]EHZ2846329.1 TldD/PmbA family protein [Vibrio vulnificus]EIO3970270.1 TldD/PmbA family protein [Vibrio vulnificus]EIV8616143.1 TldD/PmbA family protein [Vibrio vulnificus]EJT1337788.1 TldD/PmbA family protein [Vibrio vulnificus]EKG2502506.1 TldD/PmbA family protein [Vibrio vulnificus]
MLNPVTAKAVIDHALFLGADFAELFVEHHQTNSIQFNSQEVDKINSGIDFGIGIRLFFGHKVLYGFTNSTEESELKRVTSLLAAKDKRDQIAQAGSLNFIRYPMQHISHQPLNKDPYLDSKIAFLHQADLAARAQSDKITQFMGSVLQREQQIEIFNSEGLHIGDTRHYVRVATNAVAQDGSEQSVGMEGPGALMGWEFSQQLDAKALGQEVAEQALVKLNADVCPSGEMPVVIGNGFGGVIFHEACGHLLETTSVAKKASVFHDKMGEMIAHSAVSAVDDGTMTNEWGSIHIDDEGMETQRTQLIKDGKLTSFMVDKMGGLKTGYAPTGSGRRQNYKFAPTSRMRNTFIEEGESSFDEMISSIEKGIYAKKLGGGSVQPGTGEFNFAVREAYLIENGKITKPLKTATLISTGPKVLKEISMVGKDMALAPGMCGSVSGSVPTTVGQPSLKVDKILVGGGN